MVAIVRFVQSHAAAPWPVPWPSQRWGTGGAWGLAEVIFMSFLRHDEACN